MRKNISGDEDDFRSVHTSYNVEETILVLKPLKLDYFIPRKKFLNFYDFFNMINANEKLKYVILFDYNVLHTKIDKINKNINIKDLLKNYFYFK